MIVCCCTGATDRDVRAGDFKIGRCGGCAATIREIRESVPRCVLCEQRRPQAGMLLGFPICEECAQELLCNDCRRWREAFGKTLGSRCTQCEQKWLPHTKRLIELRRRLNEENEEWR